MFSCIRPKSSRASQSTQNPPAPTPRVRTSIGTPGTEVVSGVKANEAPLAGYLMARAAMHRNIEGPALANLRAGHETVQQGSQFLSLGRANVYEDLEKASGLHLPMRRIATNNLAKELLTQHKRGGHKVTQVDIIGANTAASQHAKTGTCGTYAEVNTTLHAGKLASMKDKVAVVALAEHQKVDHGWAEMMPKGRNADRSPILHGEDVIMDGWCKENLAILREDGAFARLDANGNGSHMKHREPLDHITGPEVLKSAERFKAKIDKSRHYQEVFNRDVQLLVDAKYEWPKSALWAATSVFPPDFRSQASAALHKDAKQVMDTKDVQEAARHAGGTKKSPMKKLFRNRAKEAKQKQVRDQAAQVKQASLAEIQAIGVARSLGSNIRGAKAEAPGIIASAKELFPGPRPSGN